MIFFKNNTSGNVVIQELVSGSQNSTNDLELKDYLGQTTKARFITGGQVELYFADIKKFETTGAGATVYGSLNATQFVGDGSGLTGVVAQGTGIVIQDEGSSVGTAGTINFVGAGVLHPLLMVLQLLKSLPLEEVEQTPYNYRCMVWFCCFYPI